jgi:hypothetical protein
VRSRATSSPDAEKETPGAHDAGAIDDRLTVDHHDASIVELVLDGGL